MKVVCRLVIVIRCYLFFLNVVFFVSKPLKNENKKPTEFSYFSTFSNSFRRLDSIFRCFLFLFFGRFCFVLFFLGGWGVEGWGWVEYAFVYIQNHVSICWIVSYVFQRIFVNSNSDETIFVFKIYIGIDDTSYCSFS